MIDILLATYNAEKYLKELLDSIFSQTYSDFRLIIGDDNSSDNTIGIINEYSHLYPEKIDLHKFSFEKSSAKENFFRLLDYSENDYLMFADQDDVWCKNKIQKTISYFENINNSVPHLVHTDLYVTDENMNIIFDSMFVSQQLPKDWSTLNNFLVQNCVTGCTLMINKALKNKIRIENPANIIMHDWWIALVASAFGQITFIDEPLIYYRQHKGNTVGFKDVSSAEYVRKRLSDKNSLRKNISDTYVQAKEFLSVYGSELSDLHKEILEIYSCFSQFGKNKKIKYMNKYMLWKNTGSRRMAQILWG